MKTQQKIGGGRFNVETEVCGSGEPLLYLHGAGGLVGIDPFLELLGKDFKVIAPHLPGYGESTGGELIEDVVEATHTEGFERAEIACLRPGGADRVRPGSLARKTTSIQAVQQSEGRPGYS